MLCLERLAPHDPRFPLSGPELAEIFDGLTALFGLAAEEVSLRIVDDREMAGLNSRFMHCLGPTNILSFPTHEPGLLGDLVLSAETLARETFLYNQGPYEYTMRLLAHGLLHLAGYDHGPEMDALTEQAVSTLGGGDLTRNTNA